MDYSSPGSSVHGILQARIPEWVAIPFFRGSSWPRDRTQVSCIAGSFFTAWATREAFSNRILTPEEIVVYLQGKASVQWENIQLLPKPIYILELRKLEEIGLPKLKQSTG